MSAVLETCVSDFCLTQVPADLRPPVNEIVFQLYILYAVVKEPGFLIFAAMVFSRDANSTRGWWALLDSNQRPPPYQGGALTN